MKTCFEVRPSFSRKTVGLSVVSDKFYQTESPHSIREDGALSHMGHRKQRTRQNISFLTLLIYLDKSECGAEAFGDYFTLNLFGNETENWCLEAPVLNALKVRHFQQNLGKVLFPRSPHQ